MLKFENKVIVITGAGRGIGFEYAHFFAERKAKLLLNDNSNVGEVYIIEQLAKELRSKYQTEIATDIESVENGNRIIENAIRIFKRIDVLINNAGILLDRSMAKITIPEFDAVLKVHLKGTFKCVLAAWQYFKKQKYGRIINTGSSSGLFGNFGQANYSAAKAGIHGMTLALAKEGENYNIKVNTIAPIARTRMTEGILPDEIIKAVPASAISALVGLLAHEDCPESGQIFEVGGGWIGKLRWQRAEGGSFPLDLTPEELTKNWDQVVDFERNSDYPTSGSDSIEIMFANFEKQSKKKQNTREQESKPSIDQVYNLIKSYINGGGMASLARKCDCLYQFCIKEIQKANKNFPFWISLRSESQKVGQGSIKGADVIYTLSDNDLYELLMGKVEIKVACDKKQIEIQGDLAKGEMLFNAGLFPKPTKENINKYAETRPKL